MRILKHLISFQCLDADENEVQATGNQEIKVEENISEPSAAAASCQNRLSAVVQPQHHRDIRTVLVKEESTLVLNEVQASHASRHIRWNIEPVNSENVASPCKCSRQRERGYICYD